MQTATLLNEIREILKNLTVIETHDKILDDKTFSSLDLCEALNLTQKVITDRINDGVDDWKHDDINNYHALFASIKEQIKETVIFAFSNKQKKTSRFVNTYNTLIVERLFCVIRELGPTGTLDLIEPIIQQMKNTIEDTETYDPNDVVQAKHNMSKYQKNFAKPSTMTKERRYELIATMFEQLKEAA